MKVLKYPHLSIGLYLFAILLLVSSCGENPFSNKVDEGIIIYSIEYPEISPDNVMLELMPKKMEMQFKDHDFRNDIIAGMGLFRTSIISKKAENQLIHSVKMLDKRYFTVLDEADIKTMNPELNDLSFEYTGNEKEIAGFNCKEVIAKQNGETLFIMYYTEQIAITGPNRGTPFKEIPGVLMEYDVINYKTHMHFQAEEVIEMEVPTEQLSLEDGYVEISADELKNEIQIIFDKVQ